MTFPSDNRNINLQIDILYKRVPLPDHYTLIDIAYIYSWKRVSAELLIGFAVVTESLSLALQNEPMKFFFKITDINLADRFDYVEPLPPPEVIRKPLRTSRSSKKSEKSDRSRTSHIADKKHEKEIKSDKDRVTLVDTKENDNSIQKKITEEIKTRIQNEPMGDKNSIYTNITLNRSNNVEIITKIQKVSNKDGQPIGLNIIKQTVKKPRANPSVLQNQNKAAENTPKVELKPTELPIKNEILEEKVNVKLENVPKIEIKQELPKVKIEPPNDTVNKASTPPPDNKQQVKISLATEKNETPCLPSEEDIEKSNFLKSIELTAKSTLSKSPPCPRQDVVPKLPTPPASSQKRKNSSPVKNVQPPTKKPKLKVEKKSPKRIQNPTVRQIVTNVNQGATTMNKLVEQNSPKSTTKKELQSLFDSCKINIPSSLSITLKDSSDDDKDRRTPGAIKPVQNYIEILKLPDTSSPIGSSASSPQESKQKAVITSIADSKAPALVASPTSASTTSTTNTQLVKSTPILTVPNRNPVPSTSVPANLNGMPKLNPRSPQTFQKMFEEAIKKPDLTKLGPTPPTSDANSKPQKSVLDLSTNDGGNNKRNILEIASQLQKKTKLQHEANGMETKVPVGKVPIPRLNSQKVLNTPTVKQRNDKTPVTSMDLHSSRLGINYTVSVSGGTSQKDTVKTQTSKQANIESKDGSPVKQEPQSSPSSSSPKPPFPSPKLVAPPPKISPINPASSKIEFKVDPLRLEVPSNNSTPSKQSPKQGKSNSRSTTPKGSSLSPNQLLEKYNIQNLAQLTASFNFNPANFVMSPAGQLAALQQAMILKHFEMQNRQNWLSMNQSPLLQYEKYLQSLGQGQNHLLGNIKEN